ncbi:MULTISPECIES: DUF6541 family protein [Micromonospora]|uniref:4-amino-4-deoxy-L-arabinose transferase n=1 Tax=Micromonospora solifontis TaxID=2487138 RepID=A0ABX9WLY8_9ACTN|nr:MULTISPECIES: DUF6541 family protein [Micromonospora]NES12954.1 hypothetical protein [Micromonospora sp. PPF5-17B]NES34728.1 hypothetical protein [Micromonospora solifontis]NES54879.1 hypothetical protein [Micromonospora sp. PPF5-6]RNM01633.1 hypothetical protein EFE23_00895 [Micromonospora solifontis]
MTTLITLVVAIVPGALLGFALPPGRYRWAVWAAAPALTLGLIALAMAWLPALGLPDSASAVLVVELLVAGTAVLLSRLVARRAVGRRAPAAEPAAEEGDRRSLTSRFRVRPVLPRRADLIGVAVPSVISVAYGWAMVGRLVAIPGWDAMNHGYLARRILDANSVEISSVCSSGSTDPIVSCEFYPLAENVAWAQATHLSGGLLSATMTAWATVVGPLALVAGIYAAVRVLRGGPVIAAAAATAPVFLGPMWASLLTGRVNEQTAPCLAGGVALLIALTLRGPHPVRLGLLAGLASAGIVMMHSYDVLFVGVLAFGLLLLVPGALTWRRGAAGLGAAAVAGLVPLLPLLEVILGANGERISDPPILLGQWGKAFEFWVTDPQRYVLLGYPLPGDDRFQLSVPTVQIGLWSTMACLLASPLSLVLPQLRWARPWLLAGVVFTLIGIFTVASSSAPARILASLWYGDPERPRSMIFPVYGVLTVAGAVVLGLGIQWLLVRLVARARTLRGSAVPAAVAASVVVLSLTSLALVSDTWRPLRKEMVRRAPVGPEYTRAFTWLAEHTPPGKVVAYDRNRQFMSWSYADYGTPTLFGIPPLEKAARNNYTDRWRAFNWLVNNKKAPRNQGCTVRRFGIEYLVVGGRDYQGWDANYQQRRLDASERLTLVHREGHVRIYQVTDAGRACSSAP